MEDCNSNTPTGESGQIGAGHANAIRRRNAAAGQYAATGDPAAKGEAIEQHSIAEGHAAHPDNRK